MTPYLTILKNFSKPHWFDIIQLIKCSGGLSVGELSEELGMSYMGIKKHCLAMQKLGYLDTWRRPKDVGRPEKTYRITKKLDPLFPKISDEVSLSILEAATQLDPNAAEKLLFYFFRDQTESLAKLITADSVQERAEKLAAERSKRGYFSFCYYSEEEGLYLEEFHNPLRSLFEKYETLERMEVQMFEKLLGAHVERTQSEVSGLTRYRFDLSPR
ncbi:MAG: hypothetical protein P1U85_19825 [Verrucomicrobiales bacterium]|nr:hypothetical protein [Verrucomicrobiales bacterium]